MHRDGMSKNISISDEVYRALKRRKRGRSFSETIEETMEQSGQLSDVVGEGVLSEVDLPKAREEIKDLSRRTLERLEGSEDEAA